MAKLYINGELVEGKGQIAQVLDPADNHVIEEYHTASPEQCEEALEAAKAALESWGALPMEERIGWLQKIGAELKKDQQKITEILSAESGKPYYNASYDVDGFLEYMDFYIEEGRRMEGTTLYNRTKVYGELYHAVERRPLGVVVGHIAWNYPIAMMVFKLATSMIAGDPIVIKPAGDTPLATLYVGEICHRIGLPKGVVNFVAGPSSVVGKALNESTIPQMITVIGSSETGRKVMHEATSTSVKRFSMELGGNAPVIIMPDADLDKAVADTVAKKSWNTGQDCTNMNRIYVHESLYEEYLAKVAEAAKKVTVGEKDKGEGMFMGPMINRKQRDRILDLIEDAKAKGATVVVGGDIPAGREAGNYVNLTLLRDCTEDMLVSKEEIFGPIIAVRPFSDFDAVLKLANDTNMGLASYFYGHDARQIAKFFETIQTGDVYINGGSGGANTPHVGAKQSGIGCDQSKWSLEEYFQMKRISMIP